MSFFVIHIKCSGAASRAYLVIAAAFIGPFVDPVRNNWVISFGLVACGGVIPLALIAGSMRGIPLP